MHKNDFKLVCKLNKKGFNHLIFTLFRQEKKRHVSNLEELSQGTDDLTGINFFSFLFYKIHSAFGDVKMHLLKIPSGSVLKYSENGLTDCSGNKKETNKSKAFNQCKAEKCQNLLQEKNTKVTF